MILRSGILTFQQITQVLLRDHIFWAILGMRQAQPFTACTRNSRAVLFYGNREQ
jgi:hypothetical protein